MGKTLLFRFTRGMDNACLPLEVRSSVKTSRNSERIDPVALLMWGERYLSCSGTRSTAADRSGRPSNGFALGKSTSASFPHYSWHRCCLLVRSRPSSLFCVMRLSSDSAQFTELIQSPNPVLLELIPTLPLMSASVVRPRVRLSTSCAIILECRKTTEGGGSPRCGPFPWGAARVESRG